MVVCVALLTGVAQTHAFELLVEVSGDEGVNTVVGPYVYRSIQYSETGGVDGTIRADYRDGHIVSQINSTPGRTATARGVLADEIHIRLTDAFVQTTIDIPWRMVVRATSNVPRVDLNAVDSGAFRWRLLSPNGSVDERIALRDVFDGTLATDGQYAREGVLSLPAQDTVISPYEIFVSELGPTLSGNLVVDAYVVYSLPDKLEIDVLGCSFLDQQSLLDSDGDALNDAVDNCKGMSNPDQIDADGDGIGNRCDGDFNNDGTVNTLDMGLLRTAFFSDDAVVDMDSSGVVNVSDLGLFKVGYLRPPGLSCVPPQP